MLCSSSASSNVNSDTSQVAPFIRSAHCTEIFRAEFYKARKSDVTISPRDLDEIIVDFKVRPSILVGFMELAGSGLGLLARITPQPCGSIITKVIEDAASQQFNDSIRDLAAADEHHANDDIKETLKYHRDLDTKSAESYAYADASSSTKPTAEVMYALSAALSAALNLTKKF
jgi:demethoxyubiquinone hydroxylase (CLK1/Coq7/Cat5 family)